ncbi:hypothetical protein [Persicobacter diffluens]|uniref:Uncharacterized protein n=1 Tax=Persicobacter diffluens TaxID=981 RepID=A0AAN4W0M5_9BACT|nr:hypothetical protein PEDI_40610 [Persicobacter diffluens]
MINFSGASQYQEIILPLEVDHHGEYWVSHEGENIQLSGENVLDEYWDHAVWGKIVLRRGRLGWLIVEEQDLLNNEYKTLDFMKWEED